MITLILLMIYIHSLVEYHEACENLRALDEEYYMDDMLDKMDEIEESNQELLDKLEFMEYERHSPYQKTHRRYIRDEYGFEIGEEDIYE